MKTYTDDEIVRALECCIKSDHFGECFDNKCPMISEDGCKVWGDDDKLLNMLHDLIKRQQAEIARLETECNDKERAYTDEYCLRKEWQSKCSELLQAKSEAVREFAERLKEKASSCVMSYKGQEMPETKSYTISAPCLDELVKEMTEERK